MWSHCVAHTVVLNAVIVLHTLSSWMQACLPRRLLTVVSTVHRLTRWVELWYLLWTIRGQDTTITIIPVSSCTMFSLWGQRETRHELRVVFTAARRWLLVCTSLWPNKISVYYPKKTRYLPSIIEGKDSEEGRAGVRLSHAVTSFSVCFLRYC